MTVERKRGMLHLVRTGLGVESCARLSVMWGVGGTGRKRSTARVVENKTPHTHMAYLPKRRRDTRIPGPRPWRTG